MKILGRITLFVQVNAQEMNVEFFVCEQLKEDMILGIPWMEYQQTIIDSPGKRIYAGKQSRFTIFFHQ